jgi:SAM-dependent methyltransferase
VDVNEYARLHRQFVVETPMPLLEQVARPGVVADLGCGDGTVLWTLHRRGLLTGPTYAVDVAPERVRRAEGVAPGVVGVVADATRVPLADGSVDGVVASMVIEHVPDDAALVAEVARLLRPGGWWYVSTVIRGRRAWWIYEVDGVRRLDPTHVREYESEEEVVRALAHPALAVHDVRIEPLRYPLPDLVLRALARAGAVADLGTVYERHPFAGRLRGVTLRVPGYQAIEVAGARR